MLEIVPHVPKPAIIYCNKKKSVREILKRLKTEGIYRCCDYTGNTPAAGRLERLYAFHRGDIHFVVGTNAFGLGIDKQNVRTVIHFDVPHSLDACYQEIGRAARDGHTGHAFIFYSPRGMGEATRRGRAILTAEKAWHRAQSILRGRYPKKRGCLVLLPAHAVPSYIRTEGGEDSDLNRKWNLATLNILERQGLVDIKGVVYRHMRISKPRNYEKGLNGQAAAGAMRLAEAMGRKQTMEIDLAEIAPTCQMNMAELHSQIITLADAGKIALEPLDDDRGEMWVLAELNDQATWSRAHMEKLEDIRQQDIDESNVRIEALRRFFKSKDCRLGHFAELYDFPAPPPCGQCDRCAPRLNRR